MSITLRRSGFYQAARCIARTRKKTQVSLPDLIRQSILLRRLMDTRVKPAHDAFARKTTLKDALFQNSGGICATFSGPKNTTPSTKRNGNARAFLPSSTASLPSA